MRRVFRWGAIVVLLSLAFAYAAWSFYQMQRDTRTRENEHVVPRVAEGSVREIGYIYELRVTRKWSERKKEIMWWVKVPKTDKIYSCSWEHGYSGFQKDDGVVIIHAPGGADSDWWGGYIIALHGRGEGKVASVWALDLDDILPLLD